jgi:multiple antibiotic resistance protein
MIGLPEIFTLFFVMLGPLKVIGPFAQRTRDLDASRTHGVAWWTFLVASIGIVAGSLIGRSLLTSWHVSLPALRLTGGLIFFLVALRQLLEQYEPPRPAAVEPLPPSPIAAGVRLAFPMVLTPYGIAAAIALLAASDSAQRTISILGILIAVMALDLLAMWFARRIVAGYGVIVLQVLGAVLAVLQVALSVQIILGALRDLGVLA